MSYNLFLIITIIGFILYYFFAKEIPEYKYNKKMGISKYTHTDYLKKLMGV